jgi:CHRD domain-containing protein
MTTRLATLLTLALAVIALGVACGGDDEGSGAAPATTSEAAGESITVDLAEQNGSGESGTATLTADGQSTTVAIELTGVPAGTPQPAHIHDGTCTELGDVVYPLTNVEDGSSETTVNAPLSDLMGTDYAINVHESEAAIQNYVSCGDLPKS